MAHECELVERGPQPTLSVRRRVAVQDLPQVLPGAWGAVMGQAGKVGAMPAGPPYVAYHNMDMQDLDVEIGFPFAQSVQGDGEVVAGEIPDGRAATCMHVGPYDRIGAAYEALQKWMDEEGHKASGAPYEFYLNDPRDTPAEELQTQIVFPLA